MIPGNKLIRLFGVLLLGSILVFAARLLEVDSDLTTATPEGGGVLEGVWLGLLALLCVVAVYDAVRGWRLADVTVRRTLPSSLALGAKSRVSVSIDNPSRRPVHVEFIDDYPPNVHTSKMPVELQIPAQSAKTIEYTITPYERGLANFGLCFLRIRTPWGLWQRQTRAGEPGSARVYSNFLAVSHIASVGLEQHLANVGIHLQQRRGAGSDFHQLREFREGDAIRQIDWKATARYRKPISRDYQSERDQNLIFLLDCGRLMRNQDEAISYFDHALNAVLVTSYIALRQGDAVGLMSFAGEERWLSPGKGVQVTNQLLNQLFDLHSSTSSSDYLGAAQRLLARYTKRSLLVIVSNVQQESSEDLKAAVALLRRKHFVLVASLRNELLDQTLQTPVSTFGEALDYCESIGFQSAHDRLVAQLRGSGVFVADVRPKLLHIGLVNEYLNIKRMGLL